MIIRRATLTDLPQLSNIFELYRVWYGQAADPTGAKDFLRERMEKEESVVFVAEDENKQLVGFTQLYPLFSSTRMKRLWLLNDLFVEEKSRGKGISKKLIKAAQDHCRQTNGCAVTLETQKSNDIGNNLYPATGFELNEEHNFYEWPCED